MTKWLIHIYDLLERHKRLFYVTVVGLFVVFGILAARITTDEDITGFLPLDDQQRKSMEYYADFSDADRIVVIFEDSAARVDVLMAAVDSFEVLYNEQSENLPELNARIEVADYVGAIEGVYENMPLFLDSMDYERMDSLLASPDYVDCQMQANEEILMFPVSSFVESRIQYDPLNLFEPVVQKLRDFIPASDAFQSQDGYMMSRDGRMAFCWLQSPYGQTESNLNAELVDRLNDLAERSQMAVPGVDVRINGAPVVAVENARCIKHDTMLASIVAVILICAILWFRLRNLKSILLVMLSVAFGWICAVATLVTFYDSVSMIVIGVGSILIGIAANYPLHVVMHNNFAPNAHENIKEIAEPLIIGNITTVGAFCSLLLLDSVAMRELGLFAISLLLGTILFSVIFLPHLLKSQTERIQKSTAERMMSCYRNKKAYWFGAVVIGVTIVFAFLLPETSFDSNLSNVNYMTAQQREDFVRFAELGGHDTDKHKVYLIHDAGSWNDNCVEAERMKPVLDSLIDKSMVCDVLSVAKYMPSEEERKRRIRMWKEFTARHKSQLTVDLNSSLQKYGFTASAVDPFSEMVESFDKDSDTMDLHTIAETLCHTNVHGDIIADYCYVNRSNEQDVLRCLNEQAVAFTAEENNQHCVESLSDDFNFIGLVCSIIVFLFLWISFRKLSLAVIAFIPMAVSWIWILGIMGIAGLKFNIVNIILATFIFGQGDDYTIFIVNGLEYEHKTGKSIMGQFGNEIVTSAAIMLAGIGTLAISNHPAIFSLGIVTLIGMCTVVLMSIMLPPVLYQLYLKITNS